VLLDVEGTTTPIDFVYGTLFPYARERVGRYLAGSWRDPATQAEVARLRAEHAAESEAKPAWREDPDAVAAWVHWMMHRDRKSTGLKSLQGRIWEDGYRRGELRGLVYHDVSPALQRWSREGLSVAIFSSGSVLAQRLLFTHSTAGDLTRFLAGYFDTTTGPKREAESYRKIAAALGTEPASMLFVSDVEEELDAAAAAGARTALSVRDDTRAAASRHRVVHSFDAL